MDTLGRLAEAYEITIVIEGADRFYIEDGIGAVVFSEEELRMRFPHVLWEEPMHVEVDGVSRWSCRYCIGMSAMNTGDVAAGGESYASEQEVYEHIGETHR